MPARFFFPFFSPSVFQFFDEEKKRKTKRDGIDYVLAHQPKKEDTSPQHSAQTNSSSICASLKDSKPNSYLDHFFSTYLGIDHEASLTTIQDTLERLKDKHVISLETVKNYSLFRSMEDFKEAMDAVKKTFGDAINDNGSSLVDALDCLKEYGFSLSKHTTPHFFLRVLVQNNSGFKIVIFCFHHKEETKDTKGILALFEVQHPVSPIPTHFL